MSAEAYPLSWPIGKKLGAINVVLREEEERAARKLVAPRQPFVPVEI